MSESDVRQLGVSEARANMTELIAEVRLLGKPVALTRRDKPQAMLISMDRWKAAVLDAEVRPLYDELVEDLRHALRDPEFAEAFERKLPRWHELFENNAL
ncbi:type II toxin-antitoxin system prevent-host-death family antitoxin [Streptomyces sp. F-1]|uniref:type II toxin-antitoxin system prevent-host-death family antitoxin n=1 Tax=Streptomyces sp. F-1 TaxID=463642 RepID=UPI00086D10BF|nr:type II toxin-antitoxin system prevent-host-death family antitoxin [Streptomyces sp. F-1]SFY52100.1 hypothetical protein STEPF1_05369 [Streptomyces sp. F-1]